MSTDELKEFDHLCEPLVEWLRKNHDPHTEINISSTEATLLKAHMGAVYPYREGNDVVVELKGQEIGRATIDFGKVLTHTHNQEG